MSELNEPLLGSTRNDTTTTNNNNNKDDIITSRHLDPEQAETSNVARLEEGIIPPPPPPHSAQPYEEVMHNLLSLPDQQQQQQQQQHQKRSSTTTSTGGDVQQRSAPPSFKSMAKRVMLMQRLKEHQSKSQHSTPWIASSPSSSSPQKRRRSEVRGHRKCKSTAAELLNQITTSTTTTTTTTADKNINSGFEFEEKQQHYEHAVFHSAGIAAVSSTSSSSSASSSSSSFFHPADTSNNNKQNADFNPLRSEREEEVQHHNDHPQYHNNNHTTESQYGSIITSPGTITMNTTTSPHHLRSTMSNDGAGAGAGAAGRTDNNNNNNRRYWHKCWKNSMCRRNRCCPAWKLQIMGRVLLRSYLLTIAVPLFVAALFLFYVVGNPPWDFIPGTARSAWLLNFLGRQVVTFELARLTQYILIDVILLSSRTLAYFVGPFVTMTAVQSKGWPSCVTAWACWDLLILYGEGEFRSHWLYWTGWKIYSAKSAISGEYILKSTLYLQFLLAMILVGVITTAKRMMITIHFGRRMLVDFKPRLEKLLADMVLVSEIADLADEATKLSEEDFLLDNNSSSAKDLVATLPRKTMPAKGLWSSVKFKETKLSDSEGEDDDNDDDDKEEEANNQPPEEDQATHDRPMLKRSSSGSFLFKNRLDKWEEPERKQDKSGEASIEEVLKFKHALNYMDDVYPFGKSYGKASDRNQAIEQSHILYHKLLKCSSESSGVPFEVISWITLNEENEYDPAKLKALRRLFHPDVHGNLPLLAFILSCDTVYKRFRYFKASVSNASVIDNQLERILNGFYGLLVVILVLLIMQINPWPILLSMTSLLVSVSFALGPSVSKYVEGIMLIAVRRPFDLGDRILINSTESADSPGATLGWFVEDITLSSTTLRFSKSNEIATVSNFSMSQSKIVNCQRSPSAVIIFKVKLHLDILEGNNLKTLTEELQTYVRNNPRIWASMIFIRQDFIGGISTEPGTVWSPNSLDADYKFVIMTLCFQHRTSWQSAARIMIHRGDLIHHMYKICVRLGVQYDDPAPRRVEFLQDSRKEKGAQSQAGLPFPAAGASAAADPTKLF